MGNKNFTVIDNSLNVGLPKWPAILVKGKSVSTKQAAEIIIRTDSNLPDFTYSCNDNNWIEQLNDLFGFYKIIGKEGSREHYDRISRLKEIYRMLDINYLTNDRIASSWIGGTNGWINWDGFVGISNKNIGKYPNTEEVCNEWCTIAEAFPFLNLRCQLMNGESCEDHSVPVIEYIVKDGFVTVCKPGKEISVESPDPIKVFAHSLANGTRSERGTDIEHLKKEIIRIYGYVPRY